MFGLCVELESGPERGYGSECWSATEKESYIASFVLDI
jgi:hypothetical protein